MTTRVMQDLAESITRLMLLSATVTILVLVGIALFLTRKGD